MIQWREAHPQATLHEIEEAVNAQMNQPRAQLIQELVQMGEAGEWNDGPQRPVRDVSDVERR